MKFKTTTKERLTDNSKLMVAYAVSFGQIPNIKDTTHGTMIVDSINFLISTYEDGVLYIETSESSEKCNWIIESLKRFCQLLGGGEITCTSEKSISPLKEKEEIAAYENSEELFKQAYDDFEKYISRPYDDKGFLKESDWTEELAKKNLAILRLIDEWYYANINLPNVMKYYLSKTNMENFVLFCLKNGAANLKDIVENISDYHEDYLTYLSRYDKNVFDAMKKGLKCLLDVAKLDVEENVA